MDQLINIAYIVASVLFIFGIKMLGSADTARRGNQISALGMLLAVIATLLAGGFDWTWIIAGLVVGGVIGGVWAQKVQMTGMPELVALFNGFGGIASLLVGWAEEAHYLGEGKMPAVTSVAVGLFWVSSFALA